MNARGYRRRLDPLQPGPCALLALTAIVCASCASTKEKQLEAFYGPTESILEVISVLRRHVPDDTYRFPPATDFTGRNVYRSSLLRLENLERVHADALRTGYMDDVLVFAKARALERLRGYDLAAGYYRETARYGGRLQETAEISALVCDELARSVEIGIDLVDPLAESDGDDGQISSLELPLIPDQVIAGLDERHNHLSSLFERTGGSHYAFVIQEEMERADVTRARYFVGMRFALPDGQLRAVSELQRVLNRNGASKNRRRHMVDLANFYVGLAEEYVAAVPPTSLEFDPPRFQELVSAATHLYQAVSVQDGTPEKLEAARRLESFLAFSLTVDRDRFSQ